jgi:hypothetical protein
MGPEERTTWEEMARQDKARYMTEKEEYEGPWKVPANQRKPKDPASPKKPVPAYFAFSNERRQRVKNKNPSASNSEVSKILSKMWKEAPGEVKDVFMEAEARQRVQHSTAMKEWRRKRKEEENNQKGREDSDDDSKIAPVLDLSSSLQATHHPLLHHVSLSSRRLYHGATAAAAASLQSPEQPNSSLQPPAQEPSSSPSDWSMLQGLTTQSHASTPVLAMGNTQPWATSAQLLRAVSLMDTAYTNTNAVSFARATRLVSLAGTPQFNSSHISHVGHGAFTPAPPANALAAALSKGSQQQNPSANDLTSLIGRLLNKQQGISGIFDNATGGTSVFDNPNGGAALMAPRPPLQSAPSTTQQQPLFLANQEGLLQTLLQEAQRSLAVQQAGNAVHDQSVLELLAHHHLLPSQNQGSQASGSIQQQARQSGHSGSG